MAAFAAHGYERVKPPLLEFEDSLLAGSGVAVAEQTFRLMDPVSQRMMGLRADTTPQVARIAAHPPRRGRPRPLRLCYAGQVLRVRGTQLAPERQVPQAGIELIGTDAAAADAEVAVVAAEALAAVGLAPATLDVTLPTMTPALLDAAGVSAAARRSPRARARPQGRRGGGRALGAKPGRPPRALPALLRSARARRMARWQRWRRPTCRPRRAPSPTTPPR